MPSFQVNGSLYVTPSKKVCCNDVTSTLKWVIKEHIKERILFPLYKESVGTESSWNTSTWAVYWFYFSEEDTCVLSLDNEYICSYNLNKIVEKRAALIKVYTVNRISLQWTQTLYSAYRLRCQTSISCLFIRRIQSIPRVLKKFYLADLHI